MSKWEEFLENPYNREKIKRVLSSIVLAGMLLGIILSLIGAATGNPLQR